MSACKVIYVIMETIGFGIPQVQEQYNLSWALSCQTSAAICIVQLIYSEAIPAKALKAENLAG